MTTAINLFETTNVIISIKNPKEIGLYEVSGMYIHEVEAQAMGLTLPAKHTPSLKGQLTKLTKRGNYTKVAQYIVGIYMDVNDQASWKQFMDVMMHHTIKLFRAQIWDELRRHLDTSTQLELYRHLRTRGWFAGGERRATREAEWKVKDAMSRDRHKRQNRAYNRLMMMCRKT